MHRAPREESPGLLEEQCRPPDVLRRHRVGQIDDPRPGVGRQHHRLQGRDVRIIEPEVGEQGDDAVWAARVWPSAPPHRSRWITYSAITERSSRVAEGGRRSRAATPASAYATARRTA